MTYITGDIPVGAYDSTRLSNLGIGHGVIDAGGGYTYFNPQTGHEFSGVLGFTYNFTNQSTQYQNRSEEHTSELQSLTNLVCRLLLEKKNAEQTLHPTPSQL